MFATAGSAIVALGAVCGALAAVIVLLSLIAKAKPVKWVFRKLVGDPLTSWHRAQTLYVVEAAVAPIHEQLKPNGGQSVRDRVDILEGKLDDLASQITAGGAAIREGQ